MVVSGSTFNEMHAECMTRAKYAGLGCCADGLPRMPLGQPIAARSEPGVTGSPAESRPREWYQLLALTAFAKLKHSLVESPIKGQMDFSDVCCAERALREAAEFNGGADQKTRMPGGGTCLMPMEMYWLPSAELCCQ